MPVSARWLPRNLRGVAGWADWPYDLAMVPTSASILSRRLVGAGELVKMLSWRIWVEEIRGSVSMVICCCWGAVFGVGFWYSAIRVLMARMLPRLRVMIWVHAEPLGRSMSEKMALRRASKSWLMRFNSQNANDCVCQHSTQSEQKGFVPWRPLFGFEVQLIKSHLGLSIRWSMVDLSSAAPVQHIH